VLEGIALRVLIRAFPRERLWQIDDAYRGDLAIRGMRRLDGVACRRGLPADRPVQLVDEPAAAIWLAVARIKIACDSAIW
jgi:hypothetical protein